MALTLSSVRPLKAQIRLQQAVAAFESELSSEQRAGFLAGRTQAQHSPPTIRDVRELTAEINRKANVNKKQQMRCFGSRLANILEAVQQFVAIGDVMIGGSQNLIACGVWSLFRFTLLAASRFATYIEKLSELLMVVGQSTPRYQEMVALHPNSRSLPDYLSEYFIVVVQLCHQVIKMCNKSAASQFRLFLGDLDVSAYQSQLIKASEVIKEQLSLEEARESKHARAFMVQQYSADKKRRKMRLWDAFLKSYSTYDYQASCRQTRKKGTATWFQSHETYQRWKQRTQPSSVLLVTGKLGSGKTVLLANMVDDLHSNPAFKDHAVAFFFCSAHHTESRNPLAILGSLARQILEHLGQDGARDFMQVDPPSPVDMETIHNFLVGEKLKQQRLFFILDGIEELTKEARLEVIGALVLVHESCAHAKFCISYRQEANLEIRQQLEVLRNYEAIEIPEKNPDIDTFIQSELEARLESGQLSVGDARVALEIHEALSTQAEGMFLWIVLQLDTICDQKTDKDIRRTLHHLPKSLPELFTRILSVSAAHEPRYQSRLLKILVAAIRPLHVEEVREALSVREYARRWEASSLINDIFSVLKVCGSLIFIDEEDSSVNLVHPSVKQFLLGDFDYDSDEEMNENFILDSLYRNAKQFHGDFVGDRGFGFDLDAANLEMSKIVLTYLNYDVFSNQVQLKPTEDAHPLIGISRYKQIPSTIIRSSLSPSSKSRLAALHLLRLRRGVYETQEECQDVGSSSNSPSDEPQAFAFYKYSKETWHIHSKGLVGLPTQLLMLIQETSLKHGTQEPEGFLWGYEITTDLLIRYPNLFTESSGSTLQNGSMLVVSALYSRNIWLLSIELRHPRRGIANIVRLFATMTRAFTVTAPWQVGFLMLLQSEEIILKLLHIAVLFGRFWLARLFLDILVVRWGGQHFSASKVFEMIECQRVRLFALMYMHQRLGHHDINDSDRFEGPFDHTLNPDDYNEYETSFGRTLSNCYRNAQHVVENQFGMEILSERGHKGENFAHSPKNLEDSGHAKSNLYPLVKVLSRLPRDYSRAWARARAAGDEKNIMVPLLEVRLTSPDMFIRQYSYCEIHSGIAFCSDPRMRICICAIPPEYRHHFGDLPDLCR